MTMYPINLSFSVHRFDCIEYQCGGGVSDERGGPFLDKVAAIGVAVVDDCDVLAVSTNDGGILVAGIAEIPRLLDIADPRVPLRVPTSHRLGLCVRRVFVV